MVEEFFLYAARLFWNLKEYQIVVQVDTLLVQLGVFIFASFKKRISYVDNYIVSLD